MPQILNDSPWLDMDKKAFIVFYMKGPMQLHRCHRVFHPPWPAGALTGLLMGLGSFFYHDAPIQVAIQPDRGQATEYSDEEVGWGVSPFSQ